MLFFASTRDVDTTLILAEAGIDASILDDERARISLDAFGSVWRLIANALSDPILGLHFGEAIAAYGEGHFLFAIMRNSETLRKAAESLTRYHRLITDIVTPRLVVEKGSAAILLETAHDNGTVRDQVSDVVLSLLITVLRRITGDTIRFDSLEIAHDRIGTEREYERVFGLRPTFAAAVTRIRFPDAELNKALPLAQEEFGRALREYADGLERSNSNATSDEVLLALKKTILNGRDVSLDAVAGGLAMSGRGLQSRLQKEGTTFQSTLDEARKDIALHYLGDDDTMLCDIAFLLGYAEQSSFNRAFKKWTGLTPMEYRKRHR